VRPFEAVVLWIGIAFSIVLLILSVRARNPALSGVGILLGVLCYGTMRELSRRGGGRSAGAERPAERDTRRGSRIQHPWRFAGTPKPGRMR